MDYSPSTIAADCIDLDTRIINLHLALAALVRHVREARSDVDAVSRELHSLQTVVAFLKEDAILFPPELAEHTPAIIGQCSALIESLDGSISVIDNQNLSKLEKRTEWRDVGRLEIPRFGASLEAHKEAIGLALDLVGVTTIRDLTFDPKHGRRTTIERHHVDGELLTDISTILIQMGELQMRLPAEFEEGSSMFLYKFMGCLKVYAENVIRRKETEHQVEAQTKQQVKQSKRAGAFLGEAQQFGAYVGDAPDSAIDIDTDSHHSLTIRRVEACEDEEVEPQQEAEIDQSPEARLSEEPWPIEDSMDQSMQSMEDSTNQSIEAHSRPPTPPPKDTKRLDISHRRMASPFEDEPMSPISSYGVRTEITAAGHKFAPSIMSQRSKGFGKLLSPFRIPERGHRQTRSSSSSNSVPADFRPPTPITPIIQASLVRRGSHRLSVSMKKLPLWNIEKSEEVARPETKAVFGVSLQKSMAAAKGSSKTHHGDHGGSSRREFPLCIQKCCNFLQKEGASAPGLFTEPGDMFQVAKLKELFSVGPTYGEDINFANYTAYDAADLIMLYLSQLPRPLVPESLIKRWISLSRQATMSGSHAARLDQCIDFWEEALSGLRGPSRSLFKLLLNTWADAAMAEDRNNMKAEALADAVLKPLTHVSSSQHRIDYMLSLAFLIRKRGEYQQLMKDNQSAVKRIKRAAW
ncbi:Rho GTPase activation protein [Astrocystis sublimbata]|nr:Rho GTPase activation protein [Astrocystis sublimbata]